MNPKEKKKLAVAGVLMLIAVVWLYFVFNPSQPSGDAHASTHTGSISELTADGPVKPATTTSGRKVRSMTSGVDPALRLDLLAKLQAVEYSGNDRNVFAFYTPPPPPPPRPVTTVTLPPPRVDPGPTPPPPPPPIPLKFYGIASAPGVSPKRALFQSSDEIFVAVEGELVQKRYKVIRINNASVDVEDMQNNSKQTLPLIES